MRFSLGSTREKLLLTPVPLHPAVEREYARLDDRPADTVSIWAVPQDRGPVK